jgi:hypothetical protein
MAFFVSPGALVAGPGADDVYVDAADRPEYTAIGVHHNIPLIGTLGGLLSQRVNAGQCAAGQGMFQLMQDRSLPW